MPVKLPNLDDRSYADLVAEARALIPAYAPEWTNHNPSDPGITLLELFAYLAELQIYQLNRVGEASRLAFLRLINGPEWTPQQSLAAEQRAAVQLLRQANRAITCADFERLALEADARVRRARCLPRRNLETENQLAPSDERPGHVSVIVVPDRVAFDTILFFDGGTSGYVAVTGADGSAVELNRSPGDFLYVGAASIFGGIAFGFATKGQGYALRLEYFNGQKWTPLGEPPNQLNDRTSDWCADGMIEFAIPADWAQTPIENAARYWVRVSTTAAPATVARASAIACDLRAKVARYLQPRRLLTTQLHVIGPRYVRIDFRIELALRRDVLEDVFRARIAVAFADELDKQTIPTTLRQELADQGILLSYAATVVAAEAGRKWLIADRSHATTYIVRKEQPVDQAGQSYFELNVYEDVIRHQVIDALQYFLHPLTGGPDERGWPLGRDVYVSEIYALLDTLPGVDYVRKVEMSADRARLTTADGELVAVALQENELVEARVDGANITILVPSSS